MIVFFWILNFAISWFNAWVVGKSWNETKHNGGMGHFMNWMGGIMSAAGFTWCYLIVVALIGTALPESLLMDAEQVQAIQDAGGQIGPLVNQQMMEAFLNLGYIVVYFPIVGSGIAITLGAWANFYRSRTFGSGAVAAYDTAAMVYNIGSGIRHLPGAFDNVGRFFKSSDTKESSKLLVLFLVVGAALAGIITTVLIVRSSAASVRKDMAYRFRDAA